MIKNDDRYHAGCMESIPIHLQQQAIQNENTLVILYVEVFVAFD